MSQLAPRRMRKRDASFLAAASVRSFSLEIKGLVVSRFSAMKDWKTPMSPVKSMGGMWVPILWMTKPCKHQRSMMSIAYLEVSSLNDLPHFD